jgi:superfamily II DNA/RNA helicase
MLGMIWSVFNIIADLRFSFMKLQVLVLSPTRELAVQIQKVVLALGDYMNVQVNIRPLEYFSS